MPKVLALNYQGKREIGQDTPSNTLEGDLERYSIYPQLEAGSMFEYAHMQISEDPGK